MASAFVIMPFSDDLLAIYQSFVKPTLESLGFEVQRADDIENQRNILRDIIESIMSSDLIVADLTGSNANVFYELGLAHAFSKPVILLTQSIEDVPFDLKPYRLVEYNTHFLRMEEAKQKLSTLAEGFLSGRTIFGSPVTDFKQSVVNPNQRIVASSHTLDSAQDDRGFIDHLIDVNQAYTQMTEIITPVAIDLNNISQAAEAATNDLDVINSNPSESAPAAIRNVCRRLATRIKEFNDNLHQANIEYADSAHVVENSLEFLVSYSIQQNTPDIDEQISVLRTLLAQMVGGRDALLSFAHVLDQLPRIERRLNREVGRGSQEVRTMAENIDITIASVTRALRESDKGLALPQAT